MRPTGSPVRLHFDGREIEALEGETIAAALAASDIVAVRQARSGAPRGPFCGMGVCFDCLVTVDGRPSQRACLTKVAAGMDVRSSPAATASAVEPARPAEEIACDVLVVGAGPAGLSAARALALAGADVVVLDERLHPGGQFFKPLAPSHQAEISTLDSQFRDGAVLAQSTQQAGARIVNEATVWAAFSAHEVAAIVAGRSTSIGPSGWCWRPAPTSRSPTIPGWTLPGVMTVGGLQTLARSYRVAPGQRIVIAGNGPLCLQTAAELWTAAPTSWPCSRRRRGPGRRDGAALASAAVGRSLPDDRRPVARRPSRRQAALGPPRDADWSATIACARVEAGDLTLRRRHRRAEPRLRLVVGAGALAGLRPSLRAARQRLDGDADRRQRPHQPRRGLRHRRRRALRRRARRDGARARWPPPPSRPISASRSPSRARRGARSAAPRASRPRFGGCFEAPSDRSRRHRRQRRRLPLRGGDGGRAAPA